MAALMIDMMATHLKQVQDRFASARETAAEQYQKLQAANAEGSAVMKIHTSLLSSFRAKQPEFEEILTNYHKHIDGLAGNIQGVEESLTELQDGQQRVLDRLEAVLEILQKLRESTPRVPYRAPPTAPQGRSSAVQNRRVPFGSDNPPSLLRLRRRRRAGKPRWIRQL